MKKQIYIDLKPLIADKNSIIKVALSDRSDGKTTSIGIISLESFYDSGKIPIVCRRWTTEFTNSYFDTFINNIKKVRPDLLGKEYKVKGDLKKGTKALYINSKKAIIFDTLSMLNRHKSNYDWALNKNLYIDEYIPLDNRYIPNEVYQILSAYETIDRRHYDNYILICGNKITIDNPLFMEWNINHLASGWNRFNGGRLCIFRWDCKHNIKLVQSSPFGELVKGTSFEEPTSGQFNDENDPTINDKHTRRIIYYLYANQRFFGLYEGLNGNYVIDVADTPKNDTLIISAEPTDKSNIYHIKLFPTIRKELQILILTNKLNFATTATKRAVQPIITQII